MIEQPKVETQPEQYGGHEFEWSGSWLLPLCRRCGRRSEIEWLKGIGHDPTMRYDLHPEPCLNLGHWRHKYPTCEGNRVSEIAERYTYAMGQRDFWTRQAEHLRTALDTESRSAKAYKANREGE